MNRDEEIRLINTEYLIREFKRLFKGESNEYPITVQEFKQLHSRVSEYVADKTEKAEESQIIEEINGVYNLLHRDYIGVEFVNELRHNIFWRTFTTYVDYLRHGFMVDLSELSLIHKKNAQKYYALSYLMAPFRGEDWDNADLGNVVNNLSEEVGSTDLEFLISVQTDREDNYRSTLDFLERNQFSSEVDWSWAHFLLLSAKLKAYMRGLPASKNIQNDNTRYSIPQVALIQYYLIVGGHVEYREIKDGPRADAIIKKFGWSSGKALAADFDKASKSDRVKLSHSKRSDNQRLKNFRACIEYLGNNGFDRALSHAKSDMQIFEKEYNRLYS